MYSASSWVRSRPRAQLNGPVEGADTGQETDDPTDEGEGRHSVREEHTRGVEEHVAEHDRDKRDEDAAASPVKRLSRRSRHPAGRVATGRGWGRRRC